VLKNADVVFRDRNNWLLAHERIAILERVALAIQANSEQLIAIAIAEGGKPYSDTRIELVRAINSIQRHGLVTLTFKVSFDSGDL
jgi:acyl-CoA reductase-like NAD-dependent aldehyde dehydrogenase